MYTVCAGARRARETIRRGGCSRLIEIERDGGAEQKLNRLTAS